MNIVYIAHARERMILRGISENMVLECLQNPDKEGMGYSNRKISYKKFNDKSIKVVYEEEKNILLIITVMWNY